MPPAGSPPSWTRFNYNRLVLAISGKPRAFPEEFEANSQEVLRIHRKHVNGHPADGSPAQDTRTLQLKMLGPAVGPRVKQTDGSTGVGVTPRNVWAFIAIAVRTRECEIAWNRFPAVLCGQDMVDLKRQLTVRASSRFTGERSQAQS